jgi:hypothetical protein
MRCMEPHQIFRGAPGALPLFKAFLSRPPKNILALRPKRDYPPLSSE